MFERGQSEIDAIAKVFSSGNFMRYRGGEGGFTETFEKNIQDDFKVKHAVCMNSGTNALFAALIGLKLKHGDEVIVPAYTWVASAMAVTMAGGIPVLANIDETLTLDPEDFEKRITPETKAVIPVHISNRLCNLDKIMKIAKKHNIAVVEDACQAVGVQYADGRHAATIGDAGAFSFNVFKNIMCGEGGMLLTNSDVVFERGLMIHDAGCYTRQHAAQMSEPFFPGFNFRVSEVQGAILSEQYKRLPNILSTLKKHKKIALDELSKAKAFFIAPEHDAGTLSVAVKFADEATAIKATESGFSRCFDSGRHVFINWEPLLKKAFYSEELNPYNFAKNPVDYSAENFQQTLNILKVSSMAPFMYNMAEGEYREYCRKLAAF